MLQSQHNLPIVAQHQPQQHVVLNSDMDAFAHRLNSIVARDYMSEALALGPVEATPGGTRLSQGQHHHAQYCVKSCSWLTRTKADKHCFAELSLLTTAA